MMEHLVKQRLVVCGFEIEVESIWGGGKANGDANLV